MKSSNSKGGWLIRESGFDPKRAEILGSKLLIANGYMGYRGTLEESSTEQLVACTLSGVYDRLGEAWREPVNAPNGLYTRLYHGTRLLSPLASKPARHEQSLDFRHGIHARETVYALPGGKRVTLRSERFASMDDPHLLCMQYQIQASGACSLRLETGIDAEVWDINGPHFKKLSWSQKNGMLLLEGRTNEGKLL